MATVRGRNADLHGNVPDASPVALILVDVINALDFPNNRYLLKRAPALAKNIAALRRAAANAAFPQSTSTTTTISGVPNVAS